MKIVYINKQKIEEDAQVKALSKRLREKWEKRDQAKAEKKYAPKKPKDEK